MARPRTFDKDQALEKILILIWTHGSSGLSLDDIAKALKLSKTSLYSAFGNKNALLTQCLALYEERYEQPMIESFSGDKVSDAVRNFLQFANQRFDSEDTPPGCFMFNCAIEGDTLPDEFKARVEQSNNRFRQALTERFKNLASAQYNTDIESLVDMLLVNLFGLASASRMNFPLRGSPLTLLDKFIDQ